jgi:predicted XRE-type DNA-binding protein
MGKEIRNTIKNLIVTSNEVLQILGITRGRLSQLTKCGKIKPIKKNVFLLEDVLKRKIEQEQLRDKYYRPKFRND